MGRAIAAVAILLLALAGITWLALESGGVAVVETRGAHGETRSTHVWHVEQDGELYVLAKSTDRVNKERAMRRRRLKKLWRRLADLRKRAELPKAYYRETAVLFAAIARALQAVHEVGIQHRDQ